MPIQGLTDKPRLPQIGDLRKGAPKPEHGRRPGEDLEHFRFTSDEPGLEADFREAYGAAPRELPIRLPYATADENFEAWLEEYRAGGLVRRCDGSACVLWQQEDGTYSDAERACYAQAGAGCQCKETGRLHVLLPALERMGTVCVHTTSKNDILTLHGALSALERIVQQSGRDLRGVPFLLKRRPRKISTPGANGQRVRREKWLLTIEPDPAWVKLQLEEARQRAFVFREMEGQPQLTDGVDPEIVVETKRELTGADRVGLKELHTAASDYGFTDKARALRLAFTECLLGEQVGSFRDVDNPDDEAWIIGCFEYVASKLTRPEMRLEFARWCVAGEADIASPDDLKELLGHFLADAEGDRDAAPFLQPANQ